MATNLNFTSNFWNDTPGVFSGYSILMAKMKINSANIDQYTIFLKSLSHVFDDFGRLVQKTAKLNPLERESGYLLEVGETMVISCQLLGQQARDAAKAILEQAAKAEIASTNVNIARQTCKDALREPRNYVTESLKKLNTTKIAAQTRLQEKVECEKQAATVLWNQEAKQKEKDKAKLNQEKVRNAFDDAETTYKNLVPQVNEVIEDFIYCTEKEYIKLEKTEQERYQNIRENVWGMTNIISQLTVVSDDAMKNIRTSLELLNVDKEISSWVAKNRTGQSKPAYVKYIPSASEVDEIDIISGSGENEDCSTLVPIRSGRALHSYKPRRVSEISLESGEMLEILDQSHQDWVLVRRKRGKEGFVPLNYIEPMENVPPKGQSKNCLIADLREKMNSYKFKKEGKI